MDSVLALDEQLRAFMTTQLIHTAVRTGIVDALLAGPADAVLIAESIDGDSSAVLRILRGLVVLELTHVDADGRFTAAAPLELLGSDAAGSLRDAALFRGGPSYAAWLHLGDAVREGASPFERALGAGLWEYMAANPDEGRAFNGAMRGLSQLVAHALVEFLTLADELVVDVGGGHGHLVGELLDANQDASGIVLDQPHLKAEVTRAIAARGQSERCRFVGGDFFATVPSGDVYLLKWILHDWSDEDCLRILARCREAITSDGRIIIVERPLPELRDLSVNPTAGRAAVLMDLQMLAMGGPGAFQERTCREYAQLLEASGFQLRAYTHLVDELTAFVAVPI